MAIDCLPVVSSCCFSITLKTGSIIVAVLSMLCAGLFVGARATGITAMCSLAVTNHISQNTYDTFGYITYIAAIILCLTGILLLIGIFFSASIAAKLYVYAGFAVVLLQFAAVCFIVIVMILNLNDCSSSLTAMGPQLILPGLLLYFVIVVNSYEREMS